MHEIPLTPELIERQLHDSVLAQWRIGLMKINGQLEGFVERPTADPEEPYETFRIDPVEYPKSVLSRYAASNSVLVSAPARNVAAIEFGPHTGALITTEGDNVAFEFFRRKPAEQRRSYEYQSIPVSAPFHEDEVVIIGYGQIGSVLLASTREPLTTDESLGLEHGVRIVPPEHPEVPINITKFILLDPTGNLAPLHTAVRLLNGHLFIEDLGGSGTTVYSRLR